MRIYKEDAVCNLAWYLNIVFNPLPNPPKKAKSCQIHVSVYLPGSPSYRGRLALSCPWKAGADTGRRWLPKWPGPGRPHPLPRRCWAAQPFGLHCHDSAAAVNMADINNFTALFWAHSLCSALLLIFQMTRGKTHKSLERTVWFFFVPIKSEHSYIVVDVIPFRMQLDQQLDQ